MMETELHRRQSNYTRVLDFLKKNGEATNSQLIRIGGYRYGARLKELRDDGYKIVSVRHKGGLWRFVYLGYEDDEPKQVELFKEDA